MRAPKTIPAPFIRETSDGAKASTLWRIRTDGLTVASAYAAKQSRTLISEASE